MLLKNRPSITARIDSRAAMASRHLQGQEISDLDRLLHILHLLLDGLLLHILDLGLLLGNILNLLLDRLLLLHILDLGLWNRNLLHHLVSVANKGWVREKGQLTMEHAVKASSIAPCAVWRGGTR